MGIKVGKKGAEKTGGVGAGIQRTNASASKVRMLKKLEKGREKVRSSRWQIESQKGWGKVRNRKWKVSGELARFSQLQLIVRRKTTLFFLYNF